jgi:hypothetical protein
MQEAPCLVIFCYPEVDMLGTRDRRHRGLANLTGRESRLCSGI